MILREGNLEKDVNETAQDYPKAVKIPDLAAWVSPYFSNTILLDPVQIGFWEHDKKSPHSVFTPSIASWYFMRCSDQT